MIIHGLAMDQWKSRSLGSYSLTIITANFSFIDFRRRSAPVVFVCGFSIFEHAGQYVCMSKALSVRTCQDTNRPFHRFFCISIATQGPVVGTTSSEIHML